MIGLKRGTVKLFKHEKEWEIEAQNTIVRLKEILGDVIKDIQHVGSTSILTIKAKPIIDIALAIDDFNDILAYEKELKDAGFYYCPGAQASLRNQLLFACGSYYDGSGDLQTHFIHVVLTDSMDWINYINFRDYLNSTPSVAKAYEDLKVSLAEQAPIDSGREKYLKGKHAFIVYTLRKALVKSYLGKTVSISIDRPIGSVHPKHQDIVYPINYGFIPNVLGGDGENLDVYLLGVNKPVQEYTAKIIGIVHRENDVEDKLIAAPEGVIFNQADIAEKIHFQEQYYKTHIEAVYQKSCGAVIFKQNGKSKEYLCLFQKRSGTYSVPKGHMEIFETEEQTAKREIKEEIGISVDFVPNFTETIRYDILGGKHKAVVLFLAEYSGELNIDNSEISDHCWLACEQAKQTLPEWYSNVIDKIEEIML
jgi:inorganic diphosphatase